MIRYFLPAFLAVAAAAFAAGSAQGQESFPARPIRVIVPYSPGGVVDVQTRAVTQRMAEELGQPMLIETRSGAAGNIAAEFVAHAPADGYTLLVSAPFLINNPLLENDLRWQPGQFAPVGRFSVSPSYFVVPANSPAKTLKDYVEMARKAPKPLQFGGGGVNAGSTQSMSIEMLKIVAGIQLEAVAYKGAPPMVPDLISGALSMSVMPSSVAYPHIKSGAIRALANIDHARSAQLPDVSTIAEAGYPEATAESWYGFHVPAGTPPEVIRKLDAALQKSAAASDTKERLVNAGGMEAYLGTADFDAFVKTETARWQKVVQAIRK